MPKRQQEEKSPKKDLRAIDPLIVAGKDIEKVVLGYSAKTAANDRSMKVGCRYFMRNGRPYYLISDLVDHFTQNPVETSNDQ